MKAAPALPLFERLASGNKLLLLSFDAFKYGLASAAALALDWGLLVYLSGPVALPYQVAGAISFCAGLALAYILSITLVFSNRRVSSRLVEFIGFAAIGLCGLALNAALLWGFIEQAHLSVGLAKAPTAGLVFLFNFFSRRSLLFSPAKAADEPAR
jgi:putative flippase GtrA